MTPMPTPVHSPGAPAAIGPYSHAVRAGNLLFCSGQTPIDPATGRMIEGDVPAMTHRVLANLSEVLAAAGCSLSDVVKTTVFLRDMADFQAMNAVYAEVFGDHRPARSTIAVRSNPMDAPVEIECIAEIPPAP